MCYHLSSRSSDWVALCLSNLCVGGDGSGGWGVGVEVGVDYWIETMTISSRARFSTHFLRGEECSKVKKLSVGWKMHHKMQRPLILCLCLSHCFFCLSSYSDGWVKLIRSWNLILRWDVRHIYQVVRLAVKHNLEFIYLKVIINLSVNEIRFAQRCMLLALIILWNCGLPNNCLLVLLFSDLLSPWPMSDSVSPFNQSAYFNK